MKKILLLIAILVTSLGATAEELMSPNRQFVLNTYCKDGIPYYTLSYKGREVIHQSRLGMDIKNESGMKDNMELQSVERQSKDETWNTVWGEQSAVRNNYNEMLVHFYQPSSTRLLDVRFRLFDDGLGFRYEFPEQQTLRKFVLKNELTEFNLGFDYTAFALPGDYDTQEFTYTTARLSQLRTEFTKQSLAHKGYEGKAEGDLVVQTPLMLKGNGLYINIHEAALVDYACMELDLDDRNLVLTSNLVPDKQGDKGYLLPFCTSPWRTVIVSDDARDILASRLILNLNEPCKIADTSWIKPMKFVGVWWEMFNGSGMSWSYADAPFAKPGITDYTKLKPHGHHAANTANVKRYIDFAAKHGIEGVLVEGWNEGWEDWEAYWRNRQFRFDRAYPDFDVDGLHKYAASKGVQLVMHHETSANAADYDVQLDRALQFMVDNGYHAVKTGYVGQVIPRSENHSSQWMVNHYLHVAERAADYRVMVDSHEAVRPTGLCRTWPNWLAQESARGTEFEAMGGNPVDHTTILPFTRLMGGPMDYTPGIFQTDMSYYKGSNHSKARTTLCRQLALYLTMYSPMQMVADVPESYERFADAFEFIKQVPVDWDHSLYLEAEPGDYITVARCAKHTGDWYVGSTVDENGHRSVLKLNFLEPHTQYIATVYADAKDANWDTNPQAYIIKKGVVDAKSVVDIASASGGGFAISIVKASKADVKGIKALPRRIN